MTDGNIVIANEFAHVIVRAQNGSDGEVVEIASPKRERSARLDVEDLWLLAGASAESFSSLLADAPLGVMED